MSKRKMESTPDRREFLRLCGGAALTAGAGAMAGCASKTETIRIGYVSPQTGPLAAFGETDTYVLDQVRETLKGGLSIGGKTHPVEIIVKDSQSDPNRAAQVAGDLILSDKVNLMAVASTPETTNPVCEQCELNETPCISTVAPWQPWLFPRGGDPAKGFKWTYHFFWGLEDVIAVYTNMWSAVQTNKHVGGLFPNDGDGNAWGDPERGFPPPLKAQGFSLVDPGRYQNLTADFSAQIAAFKRDKVEILTGVTLPPDFRTFWTQARQQGFRPKVASVGKALLFPAAVEAIGEIADGLSTEVWWTPSHPFKSSLTGAGAAALAEGYEKASGKQWTQPLGYVHALFEVAVDTLKRATDIKERGAVRDALAATRLDTMVGPVAWSTSPIKNVAKTPLVGGQWVKGQKRMFDLVIVDNRTAPNIPTGATLKPIV